HTVLMFISLLRRVSRYAGLLVFIVGQIFAIALGQHSRDLGEQLLPHHVARRLVVPIEEPSAAGRLTEPLIRLEAGLGDRLLDFAPSRGSSFRRETPLWCSMCL